MKRPATWRWQLLRAGSFRLDGGSMFGVVPRAIWARMAEPDERNRIALNTNCLLLERDNLRVLIETGYGNKWTAKDRDIFALEDRTITTALQEINIDSASITHVIVTHLHFDHAGGLTFLPDPDHAEGAPQPTFPNARILSQRIEWQDALANKSTMTKTYLRSHLDPIARQIDLFDGDAEALPGITVFPVPGHTWGQQAVRFRDSEGVMCFPGDVLPTINHVGAAFSMGYDMLPFTNMQSKLTLLERAADEKWRLCLDHEPVSPIVTVERDNSRAGAFILRPI
ncbi:MAG: MBL fold metallo-hydrolase [Phycisphaerales bacterium]